MKVIIFSLLSVILPYSIMAQGAMEKNIQRADAYFKAREYAKAIDHYKRAIRKNKNYILFKKLAYAYKHLNDSKQAEFWLSKYHYSDPPESAYLLDYGNVLKENGKYQEAKEIFILLKQTSSDHKVELLISSCDSAQKWLSQRPVYLIKNLKKINSEYSEIAPWPYEKGLTFSSTREKILIRRKTGATEEPFYDIFFSAETEPGVFDSPGPFSSRINSLLHDAAGSFNKDQSKIYFTRTQTARSSASKDSINRLKLFSSEKKNGKWSNPEKFIFNDSSAASYVHPCMSQDERMFFFASDRPGGFGGLDIYVCLRIDTAWTIPINLGPFVNTSGNEIFPFYHNDGTLYFSSDRHPGMGGFDIYAVKQNAGEWKIIHNLKPLVNSSADDFSIFFDESMCKGYFSSNRLGGKGREDIYMLLLKQVTLKE